MLMQNPIMSVCDNSIITKFCDSNSIILLSNIYTSN